LTIIQKHKKTYLVVIIKIIIKTKIAINEYIKKNNNEALGDCRGKGIA